MKKKLLMIAVLAMAGLLGMGGCHCCGADVAFGLGPAFIGFTDCGGPPRCHPSHSWRYCY